MPVNAAVLRPRVFAPAGVAGIAPTEVPGLLLWLKADAGTKQNSDGTTDAAADGDPVGYWADQSGNNYHATQATAASRLTLKTGANGINGKPVARGVAGDFMATPSIAHGIGSGDCWLMMVMRRVSAQGAGGWHGLCSIASYTPAWYIHTQNTDKSTMFWSSSSYFDKVFMSMVPCLAELGRASGVWKSVYDGVQDGQTFASGATVANGLFYLLCSSDGGETGVSDIGELLFYKGKPSDAQLAGLRAYLNGRWAVYA